SRRSALRHALSNLGRGLHRPSDERRSPEGARPFGLCAGRAPAKPVLQASRLAQAAQARRPLASASAARARLAAMRWLIGMPYARPGLMGMDFADELRALGHIVETFAYRRDNVLYKNHPTKAAYQRSLNRRLERLTTDWRPDVVLVIKGGPIAPDVIHRMKT